MYSHTASSRSSVHLGTRETNELKYFGGSRTRCVYLCTERAPPPPHCCSMSLTTWASGKRWEPSPFVHCSSPSTSCRQSSQSPCDAQTRRKTKAQCQCVKSVFRSNLKSERTSKVFGAEQRIETHLTRAPASRGISCGPCGSYLNAARYMFDSRGLVAGLDGGGAEAEVTGVFSARTAPALANWSCKESGGGVRVSKRENQAPLCCRCHRSKVGITHPLRGHVRRCFRVGTLRAAPRDSNR